jgi:hypothetical protein
LIWEFKKAQDLCERRYQNPTHQAVDRSLGNPNFGAHRITGDLAVKAATATSIPYQLIGTARDGSGFQSIEIVVTANSQRMRHAGQSS